MKNYNNTNGAIAALVLVCALVAGCGHHQFYEGPRLAASQIAELSSDTENASARLLAINHVFGPNGPYFGYSSRWDGSLHVDLLPGSYSLTIGYRSGMGFRSDLECNFEAEAGMTYLFRVKVAGGMWKVWIVETRTGREVARCQN